MKREKKGIKKVLRLGILILALISVAGNINAGIQIRVQGGNGHAIGVGDKFYINYTLTNMQGEPPTPKQVPGGKVIYFTMTGQSSSFTSVNGRTSQSVSYTYTATCRAEKEGSYSFGPISIGDEKSNKVTYTIVSAEAAAANRATPHANSAQGQRNSGSMTDPYSSRAQQSNEPKFLGKGNDKLFLRASISKSSAYEQEALVYTVKLYTTYAPIKFIGATAAPKFDGFVVEESSATSNSLQYETYQGRQYATAVIARYIIFPQMPGKLTVKGNTYTVSTDEQEYYQDPYYSTMTVRKPIQLNVTPNDLTIDVKALPTPKPADFSGGVGSFTLKSQLTGKNLKSNQAASIIYTISGSGNLKYIHLPDLNTIYPKQLEVYSPEVDTQVQTGASNVNGSVKYDYSFMPLEPGRYEIPSVTLSYFNPATGRYEKSVSQGYTIDVSKGSGSAKSQTRSTRSLTKELINPGNNPFAHTPYIWQMGYWLVYLLPTLILLGIVWYYRKLVALKADEMGMRSRKAGKVATRRLKQAKICIRRGEKDKFYEEMLKALWGYVADKLKLPTSELNRENVSELMKAQGVSEDATKQFISLIDECEFAKYSSNAGSKNLAEIYDEGAGIINELEGSFKKKPAAVDLGHV